MDKDFLASVVVAALVAGAVSIFSASLTAFVSLRASERTIQIENVTQERAKWREKIRSKANEVWQAWSKKDSQDLSRLHIDFAVNLNPLSPDDRAILDAIDQLKDFTKSDQTPDEFSDRLSLLLKHDWERAKREAKPWAGQIFSRKPQRVTYDEFKKNAKP